MTDRELDAMVAEKVMGWERRKNGRESWWKSDAVASSRCPVTDWRPTVNVSNDYWILEKVRDDGDPDFMELFVVHLQDAMIARCREPGLAWLACYQPGDYARAALRAVGCEVGT